jgi:hypothetical protein
MLNVSGIASRATVAVARDVKSSKSSCLNESIINIPTMISAGVVAINGMTYISDVRNKASKKHKAKNTEVRPVLPPAETPAADSTYAVTEEVPIAATITLAIASAVIALPILGDFACLSSRLARRDTPIKVPIVSIILTNNNAKIRSQVSARCSIGYIISIAKNVLLIQTGRPINWLACCVRYPSPTGMKVAIMLKTMTEIRWTVLISLQWRQKWQDYR